MKNITFIILFAFATAVLLSYSFKKEKPLILTPECYISCFNIETSQMIQLDANKPGFAALHQNPLDFKLENPLGENISFAAEDGSKAYGYLIKTKKKTKNWLFVIQEWWGLNDYIKKESDKYFTDLKDMNVLALDMYDGKVAITRDSAMKFMSGAKKERLEAIVKAAMKYAGTNASIYTVGWCFGGGWSLQSALLAGKQAKGCIMFYGRPETDKEKLKSINCDVIGFFGKQDKAIPTEAVDHFENDMKSVNKKMMVYRYDAGHGFANPSNPSYNKEFTKDAYDKAIAFLKERM